MKVQVFRLARRSRAGFTLLELLLAVAVSAITASVLYAGLAIAFNARQAVTDELHVAGAGRSVLEVIRADLSGAARPVGVLAGPFVGASGDGTDGRADDELSFFTNNRLMPAEPLMGELYAVRFGLTDASGPGNSVGTVPERWLVREVRSNLLAPSEQTPSVQVLARRVWSLELRYHDGEQWQESWDSTGRGDTLPLAVELTLRLLPEKVDASASWFELEQSAVEVRRTFHLLKGTRERGQGAGR